uniref:Uncharacterized protein n=1 Tax=Rhizophora mucronata TaxID=61149 RepID=A0A2P2N8J5_RHIMU
MTRLSYMNSEVASRQVSTFDDIPDLRIAQLSSTLVSPSKFQRHDSFPSAGDMMLLQN